MFKALVNLFFLSINLFNSSKLAGQVAFKSPNFLPKEFLILVIPKAAIKFSIAGKRVFTILALTLFKAILVAYDCGDERIFSVLIAWICSSFNNNSSLFWFCKDGWEGSNSIIPKLCFKLPSWFVVFTEVELYPPAEIFRVKFLYWV